MAFDDRYGRDVLSAPRESTRPEIPILTADYGLVVEHVVTEFCGAVVGFERGYDGDHVRLEDSRGVTRIFALRPAEFLIDGKPVTLVKPVRQQQKKMVTASGSVKISGQKARVARASRIYVEGIHDATLVERIWGDDLRSEGIVVESIEGLDNLAQRLEEFQPSGSQRVGVLADHLVAGSKESRLVATIPPHFKDYVLVTGHPYIDIWQAVRPSAVKISAWPVIARGTDWKTGICNELGWGTTQDGWRRVNGSVASYRDVETPLLNAMEQLIDFVTGFDS